MAAGPGRGALAGLKRPSGRPRCCGRGQHPECTTGIDSGELLRVAIQQYLRPYRGGVAGGFPSGTGPALLRLFELYDVKPRQRAAADLHETSGVMQSAEVDGRESHRVGKR